MLTDEERERYHRQLLIGDWGEAGQEKLKKATVFIAGAGGLGSPAALYLAAAGAGRIILCDSGRLELSNLNRQVLYTEDDIGGLKAEAAAVRLEKLNRNCTVIPVTEEISRKTIEKAAGGADILVDCLDNFETRYVVNEYAVNSGVPFVHAGVAGFAGQMTFIHTPETPCLFCIFPEVPESGTIPVAGTAPAVIGSLEAAEVIQYLTGGKPSLQGRLLIWDGTDQSFNTVRIEKDPSCPVCGRH